MGLTMRYLTWLVWLTACTANNSGEDTADETADETDTGDTSAPDTDDTSAPDTDDTDSEPVLVGHTVEFDYSGAPVSFLVPVGVTSMFVEAWGAQGATADGLVATSQGRSR